MDMLSMLMNAKIKDVDGNEVGDVFGVHITGGKMFVTVDIDTDDEEEDPDGGERKDPPEIEEGGFPKIVRHVKEGTNHG